MKGKKREPILDEFTKGFVTGTALVGLTNSILALLGHLHYTF